MSDKLVINLLVNLLKLLQAACQDSEQAYIIVFIDIFNLTQLIIKITESMIDENWSNSLMVWSKMRATL